MTTRQTINPLRPQTPLREAGEPTEFEIALQSFGLTKDSGAKDIKGNKSMYDWVRCHYNNKFIPEDILIDLGFGTIF